MTTIAQPNLQLEKLMKWNFAVRTIATELDNFIESSFSTVTSGSRITSGEAIRTTGYLLQDLYFGDLIVPDGFPVEYNGFIPFKMALNATFEKVAFDLSVIWRNAVEHRNNARSYMQSLARLQKAYDEVPKIIPDPSAPGDLAVITLDDIQKYVVNNMFWRPYHTDFEVLFGDKGASDPRVFDTRPELQKLGLPGPDILVSYVNSLYKDFIWHIIRNSARIDDEFAESLRNYFPSLRSPDESSDDSSKD